MKLQIENSSSGLSPKLMFLFHCTVLPLEDCIVVISSLGMELVQLWPHRLFHFTEGIEEAGHICPIFSTIAPNLRVRLNLTGEFLTESSLSS